MPTLLYPRDPFFLPFSQGQPASPWTVNKRVTSCFFPLGLEGPPLSLTPMFLAARTLT